MESLLILSLIIVGMSFLPPLALSSSSSLSPRSEHLGSPVPLYLLVRPGLRDLCDSGRPALDCGEKGRCSTISNFGENLI